MWVGGGEEGMADVEEAKPLAGKECRKWGKAKPRKSFEINPQRMCLNGVIIRLIFAFQFKLELFG